MYVYVLVYTPSLLRVLRVFQNQYKQIYLSKSPRNLQVICPATWSLFPGGHWPFYDGTYSLKVMGSEPRLKYLEIVHWYRLRDRTSNLLGLAWKSGVLPPEPPVLSITILSIYLRYPNFSTNSRVKLVKG